MRRLLSLFVLWWLFLLIFDYGCPTVGYSVQYSIKEEANHSSEMMASSILVGADPAPALPVEKLRGLRLAAVCMARVYVGNLDPQATEEELTKEVARFGKVESVWVARSPPGFAFVVRLPLCLPMPNAEGPDAFTRAGRCTKMHATRKRLWWG